VSITEGVSRIGDWFRDRPCLLDKISASLSDCPDFRVCGDQGQWLVLLNRIVLSRAVAEREGIQQDAIHLVV